MKLYSTKDLEKKLVDLATAVIKSLPPDNGLYIPENFSPLEKSFFDNIENYSFQEICFHVAKQLLGNIIPETDLKTIIADSLNFPAPLVPLSKDDYVLELFHGRSLAFKDFGASFMATLMQYLNKEKQKKLYVLVATSGDTGGAVAQGFYDKKGIEVIILYPAGGVSNYQEKQLTTLGKNIKTFKVHGDFDDCQKIVKEAFLDKEFNENYYLTSANSINIARLLAQSFYYFEAYKQLKDKSKDFVCVVPSGNFGNITAGIFAQKLGLPIKKLVAGTNANDVIPKYLETGKFELKKTIPTISNAMDIANPSNFARMQYYFSKSEEMSSLFCAYSFSDEETKQAIKEVYKKENYLMCPHTAIAYLAAQKYKLESNSNAQHILFSTAHPAKFYNTIVDVIGKDFEIPKALTELDNKNQSFIDIEPDYKSFKNYFLNNY